MLERVGKYEVLAPLTDGGMAQLFLGATAGLGGFRKYVVIKRMVPDQADPNLERMFLDEARITAAFSHPAIAQVFDLGEDPRGLYVVMEFIAGQNLNQVVHACARQQAVLPLGFSVSVLHDCALALHYAHTFRTQDGQDQSVIHRDVAQKNIMVTYDGQVKLLDFGIAKVKNALAKTKVGTVKGTAGYMSPEQVRGEPLDPRSDVFALGIVLWEMVTGRRLFSAATELEELRLILDARIVPPSEVEPLVPEALSDVVMRALARDRNQRFPTARDVARALQQRCPDLLFDAEGRADFMAERFRDKIAATQGLFEAASSTMEDLERAITAYRRDEPPEDKTPPRARPPAVRAGTSKSGLGKANARPRTSRGTSAPRLEPAPRRSPSEEAAIDAALARDPDVVRAHRRPSVMQPVLAVFALFVVGFIAYILLLKPRETEPASSLEDRAEHRLGGDEGPGPDAPRPLDPSPPEAKAPEPPAPSKDSPHGAKSTRASGPSTQAGKGERGEVSLALFPEATVSLNGQVLGFGSFVTIALPVGTHLVTITASDGVAHQLSLPIAPGRNKPQKFQVADLPRK